MRYKENINLKDIARQPETPLTLVKDASGRDINAILNESKVSHIEWITFENGKWKIEGQDADEWIEVDRKLNEVDDNDILYGRH